MPAYSSSRAVGDDDGVAYFFVTDVNLVGARGLELAEIHQRGALAGGFPGLGLGSRYREGGGTCGILEDNVLAGAVDNGDLLQAIRQESDLVLVDRGGKEGACRIGCYNEGALEIHDKFLSMPKN